MGALKDELLGLMLAPPVTVEDVIIGLNNLDRAVINDVMRNRAKNNIDYITIYIDNGHIYTNSELDNFKINIEMLAGEGKALTGRDANQINKAIVDWFKEQYGEGEGMTVTEPLKDTINIRWS